MATAAASKTRYAMHDSTTHDATRRLSWSLAASVAAHALLIAILAGLLQPLLMLPMNRLGRPVPLDVTLVAQQRAIPFAAPPETPEVASVPALAERAHVEKPSEQKPRPPSPTRLGVFMPSQTRADVATADAPPPGDIAVGAIDDVDLIGRGQALRLATRFSKPAVKRPRLNKSLVVHYPTQAAYGHIEARIAALLIIDADGRIAETTLYPDEPMFGPAVRAALETARFTPAATDGTTVPYWTIMEFVFTMRKVAPQAPEASR
jgi:hypothetical protein